MMIAARNAMLMGGAKLPYDAEVEYLESTGTQCIDTGVAYDSSCEVEARVYKSASGTNNYMFGIICVDATTLRWSLAYVGNDAFPFVGANTSAGKFVGFGNAWHDVRLTANTLYVDGVSTGNTGATLFSPTGSINIALFARGVLRNDGYVPPVYYDGFSPNLRVASFKIYKGSVLVRDFIPVRVGSGTSAVGYLYDRANPDGGPLGNGLYPNAGTGAFVIGPDK